MNIPKTIEAASVTVIEQFSVGAKTVIRSWHNLKEDEKWDAGEDRKFPCIDLRAYIKPDPSIACGELCEIQAIIYTKLQDDQNHLIISDIEAAVKESFDTLYSQYRKGTESGLFTAFQTAIQDGCVKEDGSKPVSVCGIQFGEPLPPDDDGEGRNYVGLTLIVSYSRSDFN